MAAKRFLRPRDPTTGGETVGWPSTALLGRHRQNHNISRFPQCFETRERSLFAWPRFYRPLHPGWGYRLYPVGPTDLPDLEGIHSGQYGTRLV